MQIAKVDREELRRRIEQSDSFVLVDALPPMSYAHSHLPGAINLPPERVDELATKRIRDKNVEIIVYCSSSECESSVETARRLVALGYTNVRHYADGKKDWREAGLPLERAGERLR